MKLKKGNIIKRWRKIYLGHLTLLRWIHAYIYVTVKILNNLAGIYFKITLHLAVKMICDIQL